MPAALEHSNALRERAAARIAATGILLLLFTLFLVGCRDQATIWSARSKSPGGRWIATASTEQFGGPGTASLETNVYIAQSSKGKPIPVLDLNNYAAFPPGVTAVEMAWQGPMHLTLTYHGIATVEFQAVKCFGIEITLQHD